jgi:hypothetical protein
MVSADNFSPPMDEWHYVNAKMYAPLLDGADF